MNTFVFLDCNLSITRRRQVVCPGLPQGVLGVGPGARHDGALHLHGAQAQPAVGHCCAKEGIQVSSACDFKLLIS